MPQAIYSVPSPNAPNNNAGENTFDTDGADPEKHPLPQDVGFFSRRNLLGPVTKDHGDLPLLACSLVTGLVDGACFRNWGMFVGMQTGMLTRRDFTSLAAEDEGYSPVLNLNDCHRKHSHPWPFHRRPAQQPACLAHDPRLHCHLPRRRFPDFPRLQGHHA